MTPFKIQDLTNDISGLAELNKYNQNYFTYSCSELNMQEVTKDFALLQEYTKAYHRRHSKITPSVGDCLFLPDGQVVYFCSIYDSKAQTCGGGSFHLTPSGYLSYSGGLDSGTSFSDIELTNKAYVLRIWFCHRGYLCGGCGIYAHIQCRVWKTKVGANLFGIPQVETFRRRKLKEQSELITKIDGNGRKYDEYLPEIVIKKKGVSEELIREIEQTTGLIFTDTYCYVPVYWCQPMKLEQIKKLKSYQQFKLSEERDFLNYGPRIILEIK